ncbi:MAG: homoserine dehydrogenase [Acidimicrobiales bacterium]
MSTAPPEAMTGAPVPTVGLGLLGCGTVGSALVGLLAENADSICARTGLRLEVVAVGVANPTRSRAVDLAPGVITGDLGSVVAHPDVDVVVELMGGTDPAGDLILAAVAAGKPVVTANKELLSKRGPELLSAAAKAGVDLLFEAAVGGAIPLMRPLRESLAGDRLTRLVGIVNGTTNFILTRMAEEDCSFAHALTEAQALGYAERDPSADVDGADAAAKAAIMASMAFGTAVAASDVYCEGIRDLTTDDLAMARRLGYAVKLVAVAEHSVAGVAVRVHPALVPLSHPLASVRDVFNAVFVEGAAAGEMMFYGRGAGGRPTASAVLGDVIDAAMNRRRGASVGWAGLARTSIVAIGELESEYYLSLDVADRPGVLEKVAGVMARHQVSIRLMEQVGLAEEAVDGASGGARPAGADGAGQSPPGKAPPGPGPAGPGHGEGPPPGAEARLVLVTHVACERDIQATLAELRTFTEVDRVGTLLRVLGPAPSPKGQR